MKNWKDVLGRIRLLGPDDPRFATDVKLIWDHIEELEKRLASKKKKGFDG